VADEPVPSEPVYLQSKELRESSGLALSTRDSNLVWSHNDSGGKPRLFGFDRQSGAMRALLTLENATAVDWEDMCAYEVDGRHFLAVGDVGDNNSRRKFVTIYIVEEPPLAGRDLAKIKSNSVRRIDFGFATGPVNCESLAYDSITRSFVLVTKEKERARIFSLKIPIEPNAKRATASLVQVLPRPLITACDLSSDGKRLLLVDYLAAGLLVRTAGENPEGDLWEKDRASALFLPLRRQGESGCFTDSDSEILVGSEFEPSPLWTVPLEKTPVQKTPVRNTP
jgi:hypothetical protein